MQTPITNTGEPDDYGLIHLLTEAWSDGRTVQYLVCQDCLDLVEREAGSTGIHDCSATACFFTEPGRRDAQPTAFSQL